MILRSLFFILLISGPLAGQTINSLPANKMLSRAQAGQDIDVLHHHLLETHGGVFTYATPDDYQNFFSAAKGKLPDSLRVLELYRILGPLAELLSDAHTKMELPAAFYEYLDTEMRLLPLGVRWMDGQLFIMRDLSAEQQFTLGEELVSINGQSARECFRECLRYQSRDGKSLPGAERQMSNLFMDYYGFLFGEPEQFTLEIRSADGGLRTLTIPSERWPALEARLEAQRAKSPPFDPAKRFAFELRDQYGYLKVGSFLPRHWKQAGRKPKRFFKSVFADLEEQGVSTLVLDLRNNGGGSEAYFMPLLSYLLDQEFRVYEELSVATLSIPEHQYYPEDNLRQLEKAARKSLTPRGDRFAEVNDPSVKNTAPREPNFRGKLYVLINEYTYSAAGDFSGVLQHHDRATFIGVETGGSPNVNTAGIANTLHLPNSGIKMRIPLLRYLINNRHDNAGHGLRPDYPVTPTIADVLADRDPVLEKAEALIGQRP
ncbi:S41 family peptidase [Lewinella sp. W8]|uniref:S41 family peptidase n=1 Tax=Lewinella sp. W8 TaxID=2528208 RepID=UPI0010687BF4|nr:S41 family peptidase [Lewinella sp. W8]MTB49640.1 hypothetical protein [Lewinella sp. W8]